MNQALRTIGYFTVWGTFYGFIIGVLSGATAWIIGAFLGAFYGSLLGCMLGVIVGIITSVIHQLTFHEDTNLILYRRRLAVFNGLLVCIVGLNVLIILIRIGLKRLPASTEITDFYPLIAVFISKTTILTTLCIAYISSHYPDWIIHTFHSPDPLSRSYRVHEALINLGKSFFEPQRVMLVIAPMMLLYIGEVIETFHMKVSFYNAFGMLIMGFLLSVGTFPFFVFYITLGNAVLLTFIRRLFADQDVWDVSTYHYKYTATLISCVFTIIMLAWPWTLNSGHPSSLLAPVNNFHTVGQVALILLALLTAYHVSQTLALSDLDKEKRKTIESQQMA